MTALWPDPSIVRLLSSRDGDNIDQAVELMRSLSAEDARYARLLPMIGIGPAPAYDDVDWRLLKRLGLVEMAPLYPVLSGVTIGAHGEDESCGGVIDIPKGSPHLFTFSAFNGSRETLTVSVWTKARHRRAQLFATILGHRISCSQVIHCNTSKDQQIIITASNEHRQYIQDPKGLRVSIK